MGLPEDHTSLLHKSIMTGHAQSLETALSRYSDGRFRFNGEYGYPKLYQEAEMGNLAAVQHLIVKGYDLKVGILFLAVSPLCEAVRVQSMDAVVLLLRAGSDASQVMVMEEHSPLYVAITHGHIDIAVTLIEAGAPIDDIYKAKSYTPLMTAVLVNSPELIQLLLESGVDANQGTTPITKSASEVERDYPNERLRSAIEHAEELTKNKPEKKPETADDRDGSELIAERR